MTDIEYTPNLALAKQPTGAREWGTVLNENFDKIDQGFGKVVDYDDITNCILEVPQDIKLGLTDSTLSLKADTKVYIPDGFEADGVTPKFDVVTVDGDKNIFDITKNEKYFVMYDADKKSVTLASVNDSVSGVGAVPNVGLSSGYDTSTNIIKRYNGDLSVAFNLCSFPLAVTTWVAGSGCVSIDQVFNGFGYIGSTVFALPGVKGLIPNGRNADGSLKNIELVTDRVLTRTSQPSYSWDAVITVNDTGSGAGFFGINDFIYNKENSFNYFNNVSRRETIACKITQSSGKITSLTPKLPFRAVDYNDVALKQNFQVVSTLPSSPQADVFYFIPG